MLELIIILSFIYLILFFTSIIIRDNSIVDVFWGIGFVIIAVVSYFLSEPSFLGFIIMLLVSLWGIRLAIYIFLKKKMHVGEDPRYAKWRTQWKYFYIRSFFQVYCLQAFLMLCVSAPILLVNFYENNGEHNTFLTTLGIIISLFGFLYELVADYQLYIFKKKNKQGGILVKGLRKFSRYPQYFGESVFGFGVCIIVSQIHIAAFIGWGLISFLLCYVSGVPLSEIQNKKNREYIRYCEKTPIVFPNFFVKS